MPMSQTDPLTVFIQCGKHTKLRKIFGLSLPDISPNCTNFRNLVDDDGTLASWGFHALDTSFWNTLLRTLKHPGNDPPESPPNTYFPQTNSSPPASPREPTPPATPPYHTHPEKPVTFSPSRNREFR